MKDNLRKLHRRPIHVPLGLKFRFVSNNARSKVSSYKILWILQVSTYTNTLANNSFKAEEPNEQEAKTREKTIKLPNLTVSEHEPIKSSKQQRTFQR